MRDIYTRCGLLHGVTFDQYYKSGSLKECTLVSENTVETPLGQLVPQHEDDGLRRKFTSSLSFYENGALKKLSLQNQTIIKTPAGDFPAELVTFYECGALKRVFPLNGKLSGYWTEKNEFALSKPAVFDLSVGHLECHVICVCFYISGAIKSLTLWPKEKLLVKAPCGEIPVHIGISFYENGAIRSVEPLRQYEVATSIGRFKAFDINAIGISGDSNSLIFCENGEIQGFKTISERIRVTGKDGVVKVYGPQYVRSHFSDEHMAIEPLTVLFEGNRVIFNNDDKQSCELNNTAFETEDFKSDRLGNICDGCDSE